MHNPLHTPICDRLGIEYPIFFAGMGGVSLSRLVAAVSNAGGLGIMGAATLGPVELREEIHKTRDLTDKPFAVDLLAPARSASARTCRSLLDEGVRIFVAGLAVPADFIEEMHEEGMIVMVMCGRVRHAEKSVEAGADIVAAQGTEAGGTPAKSAAGADPAGRRRRVVPVIAAGGISDGRGLVAALALGAEGAIFGTRFIASPEAQAAPGYREALVRSNEADTMRTRGYTGKPARAIKRLRGRMGDQPGRDPEVPVPGRITIDERVMDYVGSAHFDAETTFMPAGQGVGMIHEIKPAAEIVGTSCARRRR